MKIGFSKICINPNRPAQTVGFASPKPDATYTKLDLWARCLRIVDGETDVVLLSLDSLGVVDSVAKMLGAAVDAAVGKHVHTVVACTHTHQAPSLCSLFGARMINEQYAELLTEKIGLLAAACTPVEGDWRIGYAHEPFTGVGETRISGKGDGNVYAGTLSIFNGSKRVSTVLFYNCHPTVDREDTGYFSSEWVGWTVDMMERRFPGENFMYLQGADGDVSTRFVRREKTFAEVTRLGDIGADFFAKLIEKTAPVCELSLSYAETEYDLSVTVKKFPVLPDGFLEALPPKEAREVISGKKFLERISTLNLPKTVRAPFERITLGDYRLVFCPFEPFSDYNNYINKDRELLVGYTNETRSYITAPGNTTLSYEYFMETENEQDKQNFVETIKTL